MNGQRIARSLASFVLLAGLLCGCTRVVDDGPRVPETRNVEPFTGIELRGAGRLDVLVGEPQTVTVEGSAEALKNLETQVRGDRLIIDARDRHFWIRDAGYRVRITVPTLESLVVSGATEASVHGFAGGKASLVMSGAGELEASGRLDSFDAVANGASELDLRQLAVTDARIVVNGAGNAKVQVSGRLEATVNGVGNIEYSGKPTDLKTAINGVGSIEPR